MYIQKVQNDGSRSYKPKFKSLVVEKSVSELIDKMSKTEKSEFSNLVKRLSNTKFWDMEIKKIPRDIDEFWCTFVYKKNPKKVYELGILPVAAKDSTIEFYPMLFQESFNPEKIKFSSPQRAQAMMDMRKRHAQELLERNYKSTNLQRLTRWTEKLEFLDEAYRYMKLGEVYPFVGAENPIVKERTILDRILKSIGFRK